MPDFTVFDVENLKELDKFVLYTYHYAVSDHLDQIHAGFKLRKYYYPEEERELHTLNTIAANLA